MAEVESSMIGSPALVRLVRKEVEEVLRRDPKLSADEAVRKTFDRLRHAREADGTNVESDALNALVRFIRETTVDSIPPDVFEAGSRLVMNNVKAGQLAVNHLTVRAVADQILPDGRDDATVLWRGLRASAANAALLNGVAIEMLDFTETHVPTAVHVGAVIVPALMAHVEAEGLNLERLILGVVVGVEVELALAEALMPTLYMRGFNPTAICGSIGAAAGCAAASGHNAKEITAALLIATATAAGLFEGIGSGVWPYEAGSAARSGLLAARLAKSGVDANTKLIDGPKGIIRAMSDESAERAARILSTLGEQWRTLEASYKRFPTETITQGSLEAVVALAERLTGAQRQQTAILSLAVDPLVADICEERYERFGTPSDSTQAAFDLRFVVASAFVRGVPGDPRGLFAQDRIVDPAILGLRERTHVRGDVSVRLEGARVEALLLDGSKHREEVTGWWGSYSNPADRQEHEARFVTALPEVSRERTTAILAALRSPSEPESLKQFLRAVADPA